MTNEQHPRFSESEEALIERREDQGVWNGYMGSAALESAFPKDEDHPRRSRSATPAKPRRSRPQPLETSGETVSRDMANQYAIENPVDPVEQRAINARGRAKLKDFYEQNELDRKIARVKERTEVEWDPGYQDKLRRSEELTLAAIMPTIHDKRTRPS